MPSELQLDGACCHVTQNITRHTSITDLRCVAIIQILLSKYRQNVKHVGYIDGYIK